MLLSLRAVGQPLAGVLWYQGESEALPKLGRVYTRKMAHLVAAVRRDLGQPNLPWLMVQIGRFIRDPKSSDPWPVAKAWNAVQDQQRLLPRFIRRCLVVPAIDLELDDLAHIGLDGFTVLSKRLAEIASHLVHRDPKTAPPIELQSVRYFAPRKPRGRRIELTFRHVTGALTGAGPLHGFTMVDADDRACAHIYRVRLHGNRVVLHLTPTDIRGLRLRYGHGLDPACNLVDDRGMAVPVFGPLPVN
jgi:sialate O-acetylesterase